MYNFFLLLIHYANRELIGEPVRFEPTTTTVGDEDFLPSYTRTFNRSWTKKVENNSKRILIIDST